MAAHGNLILIFGAVVFYSFIIWGIGSLYNETPDMGVIDYSAVELHNSDNWVVNLVTGIGDFMITAGGFLVAVFKMATYQDPRIPVFVTTIVIQPINIMLLGAIAFLARGGGS